MNTFTCIPTRKKQPSFFFLRWLFFIVLFFFLLSFRVFAAPSETDLTTIMIGDDLHYPPYSYLDENGEATGFNVELARAIGNAMNLEVEIRLDEWTTIRQALEDGEIHAISGMFRSPEREALYLFSSPHSVTAGDLFGPSGTRLNHLQEIEGATVAVQEADIVAEYLEAQDLEITFMEVYNVKDALQLVEEGHADYAGVLKMPGMYIIDAYEMDLIPQNLSLNTNQYAMAVMPDNRDVLLMLNGGMEILKATGEYQELYDQWLGIYEDPDPRELFYQYRWILIAVLTLIAGLAILVILMRYLIRRKTEELLSVNTEMEAAMEELIAMEQELRDQLDQLRKSQEELHASEEKNRAILAALPDIMFLFDDAGYFLDCHASNEDNLLHSPEMFLGKHIKDFFPGTLSEKTLRSIRLAIQKKQLQQFDYELIIDDETFIYEMRLTPLNKKEVVGLARDITSGRRHQAQVEYLSYHDQLTGLYNRRFIEEALHRLDSPQNLPLCIIMADVNGLKLINDSFGHSVGDDMLKTAADILKDSCQENEIVARVGGDEFVILAPGLTNATAEKLVKTMQNRCLNTEIETIQLSISFGWDAKVTEEADIHEIFKNAENYMHKKKLFERPSLRSKTIHAIMKTLHEKNPREEKHSQRVSDLCVRTATIMNFSDHRLNEIRTVGLLHDIGKISIDEAILNKPGKLTDEEYLEIKRHPEIGFNILSTVSDMKEMADYVLSHHERWDGTGYPRGLKGEDIPLQARIIAIADAYDAMIGERSYRQSLSPDEAAMELLAHAGTQFDPELTELFIQKVLKIEL
ncbi:HD domain-containing phosphohydrolase [Tindallia californiensis]|uniref:PAS domain S-box-containing protein/diguanylate cyclase (GGDEF) domain-containing protein n=1 Tax=Tindallia californiensis TaxID=159292 RepID=A0A1H3PWS0_9FIRM|nr:HD domain-containing phosphohydrolase [Tindallia californiensis]SDZ05265.1 PAS domain S-box-containing protein/diguanylate cyclase (GGDEF) domain-containing protein [Tindallia californiensis]